MTSQTDQPQVTISISGQTVTVAADTVREALDAALAATGQDSIGPVSRGSDNQVILAGNYYVSRDLATTAPSTDLGAALRAGDTLIVEVKHDQG